VDDITVMTIEIGSRTQVLSGLVNVPGRWVTGALVFRIDLIQAHGCLCQASCEIKATDLSSWGL